MNQQGKSSRTGMSNDGQGEPQEKQRPKMGHCTLLISALNDVKKDRAKRSGKPCDTSEELPSGFSSSENRKVHEQKETPTLNKDARMPKMTSDNSTSSQPRDFQNLDKEKNTHPSNSYKCSESRRDSFKQSEPYHNGRNKFRNPSGNHSSSSPYNSGMKTKSKNIDYSRSSYTKERYDYSENKFHINKSCKATYTNYSERNDTKPRSNFPPIRRANSQDSVDLNGNWDSLDQDFGNSQGTRNKSHVSKNTSFIHSKPKSGSCDSLMDLNKLDKSHEKALRSDRYKENHRTLLNNNSTFSYKPPHAKNNRTYKNEPGTKAYDSQRYDSANRAVYDKVHGMKNSKWVPSAPHESQRKRTDYEPKFRSKGEHEKVSALHNSYQKNEHPVKNGSNHWNSQRSRERDLGLNSHLACNNREKACNSLPDGKKGPESTNSDFKSKSEVLMENYHLTSGTWDSAESVSAISDETQDSDDIKTKPGIPVKENKATNFSLDGKAESLKAPSVSFICDIKPNLLQGDFFSSSNECEDAFPIPAPHPPSDVTVLTKDSVLPEEDTLSALSENLDSIESSYSSSDEEESSKSKASICEEPAYVLEPEKIKAITEYLKKIETERSTPPDISRKVVFDVNKVLRYYMNGNEVSTYGSYLSGLTLTTSNLNLALKSNQPLKSSLMLALQKALSKQMIDYEIMPFEEDSVLRESKIFCYEPDSGVTCEIMYSGKTVSDYCRTSYLLKSICKYDPRIRTLIIASRIWAEVCMIHETENGQLHPVGFALLVVYFLQQVKPPVLPVIDTSLPDLILKSLPEKNTSEVGKLWYEFLKYYSDTFNWTENVVTVNSKDPVLKSSLDWKQYSIAIQEPYSLTNVAKTIITPENAEYIISCFKSFYEYFGTSNNSDSESEVTSDKSADKEWRYSFKESIINRHVPVFCEMCDELEDELCEKCQQKNPTFLKTLEKLPQLNELSIKCIDKALLDVYRDVILSDRNWTGRKAFVEDLQNYIKRIFPDAKLTLFGSSVNKFGIKNSDLDICMVFSKNRKFDERKTLKRIASHLRRNPLYSGIFCLPSAKIPIVKFYCPTQKWNCDLSLYNVLSVHNSILLSKYALIDERCRILGCALKHLAMKGWIAESSAKTLSSYSYILMVIHYLQQSNPPVLPVLPLHDQQVFVDNLDIPPEVITGKNYWFFEEPDELRKRYMTLPRNESSLTELWIGFIDYYLKFDINYAVTITQREPMLALKLKKHARLFNIEDPFIPDSNLGCILSDEKAERTLKVFGKARSLFGHNIPQDKIENPRVHYFSTNNLTGQFGKEMECTACGAFDHEKDDCLKANPFKKYNIRIRNVNTSFPHKRRR